MTYTKPSIMKTSSSLALVQGDKSSGTCVDNHVGQASTSNGAYEVDE